MFWGSQQLGQLVHVSQLWEDDVQGKIHWPKTMNFSFCDLVSVIMIVLIVVHLQATNWVCIGTSHFRAGTRTLYSIFLLHGHTEVIWGIRYRAGSHWNVRIFYNRLLEYWWPKAKWKVSEVCEATTLSWYRCGSPVLENSQLQVLGVVRYVLMGERDQPLPIHDPQGQSDCKCRSLLTIITEYYYYYVGFTASGKAIQKSWVLMQRCECWQTRPIKE